VRGGRGSWLRQRRMSPKPFFAPSVLMVPTDDEIVYPSRVETVSVDAPSTERRSLQCGLGSIDASCTRRRQGKQTRDKNVILDSLQASVTLRHTVFAGNSGESLERLRSRTSKAARLASSPGHPVRSPRRGCHWRRLHLPWPPGVWLRTLPDQHRAQCEILLPRCDDHT